MLSVNQGNNLNYLKRVGNVYHNVIFVRIHQNINYISANAWLQPRLKIQNNQKYIFLGGFLKDVIIYKYYVKIK